MISRRLLVKGRIEPGAAAISGLQAQVEPLFPNIEAEHGLGLAGMDRWHVLTLGADSKGTAWDICHALASPGAALAGASVSFAEPDIGHQYVAQGAPSPTDPCAAAPQKTAFPHIDDDNFWFHDSSHTDESNVATGRGVRIAHLDTGWDPTHQHKPANVRRDLERNFIEGGSDATDRGTTGSLDNPGHGVGTIGLLAGAPYNGQRLGAAPDAEIIPLRVAASVVLFYTSTIAQAFDYVYSLEGTNPVDVVTMSMGGLASAAWADAVNALYEAGIFVVTAAGNNHGNLPTRFTVFPARFNRVVAACGIMADQSPYADLGPSRMAGNYGPTAKMDTALAAYTPNVPWARRGCPDVLNWDGAGTSSATPQIAGAAAAYLERYREALSSKDWRRIEAVRAALFATADDRDRQHLGQGVIRPSRAMSSAPRQDGWLVKQPPDSARFPIIRAITGIGVTDESDPRQAMLELEALQLSQSAEVEATLPEAGAAVTPAILRTVVDAIASRPDASQALKSALRGNATRTFVASTVEEAAERPTAAAIAPSPPRPLHRRLRAYTYDPSAENNRSTVGFVETTITVPWEPLAPGPIGRYVEVIDIDPASRAAYAPVDLDAVELVACDGLAPAEGSPQFHQQMCYAVVMRTIELFERALGRAATWSPHVISDGLGGRPYREEWVERLRIHPHALRTANAYYSPDKKALLFGYFSARVDGEVARGQTVFGCLSSDVVAHETAHALLDGLHRRYLLPSNPDQRAFHEAFADMIALFQHFTVREALRPQIAGMRGGLGGRSLLTEVANQFGSALSGRGALRDALGNVGDDGVWRPREPTRKDYANAQGPHDRGFVLVSAVFDAFIQVYTATTADLMRLASSGTGVLPPGAIPADLADRLTDEASKLASRWIVMLVRALDYCPPVDITFGDFLRAALTADRDLQPADPFGFRTALAAAFRVRGILVAGARYASASSLYWEKPEGVLAALRFPLGRLDLRWDRDSDRRQAYDRSRHNARVLHEFIGDLAESAPATFAALRLRKRGAFELGGVNGRMHGFEIHSVRPASRVASDGRTLNQVVVEITQAWEPPPAQDQVADPNGALYGGVTLVVNSSTGEISYLVTKRIDNAPDFRTLLADADSASLLGNYTVIDVGEPLALIHAQYRSMAEI
jgi:hypothetical protein